MANVQPRCIAAQSLLIAPFGALGMSRHVWRLCGHSPAQKKSAYLSVADFKNIFFMLIGPPRTAAMRGGSIGFYWASRLNEQETRCIASLQALRAYFPNSFASNASIFSCSSRARSASTNIRPLCSSTITRLRAATSNCF